MSDAKSYIEKMTVTQPLMEPVVSQAIEALMLAPASHGLDAGCGIGLQALLLADAVGPGGHVTGLDLSSEFLRHGEELVKSAGMSERISFRQGDASRPPFDDGSFDWAWSSCCVGYSPSIEPVPALRELARVVRPGGTVAILAWSSEALLPGHPLLESRLRATSAGIAPFAEGMDPALHFGRGLGWFRDAGLNEPAARTFVAEASAPLEPALREALAALFEMRWPGAEAELSVKDREEFERFCRPESPEFIVDRPDYYAFHTCTMFRGRTR